MVYLLLSSTLLDTGYGTATAEQPAVCWDTGRLTTEIQDNRHVCRRASNHTGERLAAKVLIQAE